jgi:hypothetical protein
LERNGVANLVIKTIRLEYDYAIAIDSDGHFATDIPFFFISAIKEDSDAQSSAATV